MSGTITLPSGDKLITQTEILDSGALVHREEVVVSGTISGRHALPTNSQPSLTTYGLPVWEINDPKRIELTNYGHSGTPLRIDPTGTTTQPVSLVSLPSVAFNGPQPISSVAGTVQVAFTPSAVQSVNLLNVGFAGTPLRTDPTGQTTQPVSVAGTISLPDYARYSEQQIQTNSLGLIDDVIHVINAALGKVAAIGGQRNDSAPTTANEGAIAPPRITSQRAFHVNFRNEAGHELGTAGTPLRIDPTGTTTQPVSIASNVNIGAVAGTVQVALTPASVQDVHLKNVGFAGTPLVTSFSGTPSVNIADMPAISLSPITFAAPQPISTVAGTVKVEFPSTQSVNLSGSISLADYSRYSEQLTQSTRLSTIDADILSVHSAIIGTPAVRFSSPQEINFYGQQPVHGTIVVSSLPPVTVNSLPSVSFSSPQPVSTVSGTVSVSFPSTQSVNVLNTPSVTFSSPQPISTIAGTVNVAFTPASIQDVRLMNVGFAGTPLVTSFAGTPSVNIADMPAISLAPIVFSGQQPIHGTVVVSSMPAIQVASGTQAYVTNELLNVSLQNIGFAGTPIRIDPTGVTTQPVSISGIPSFNFNGQQPVHGTVVISSIPSITVGALPSIVFASPQPISTIAGTVKVEFPSTQSINIGNTPAVTFSGQQPVHGTVVVSSMPSVAINSIPSIEFSSPQSISTISGTVAVSFPSAQSVNISNTPAITFSGQQSVHGTVVVSSLPPITFASAQAVTNTVLSVVGGGAEATAQRVTIASDSTGVLSIDDNGGNISIDDGGNSITVDGEINVKLLNYGHSGTPLKVDPTGTTTQPISWTGTPAVSLPGTITANIRNSIFTHKTARIDIHGAGNTTIVPSVIGKRIKVYAINSQASTGGTVNIAWMDGTLPMAGTQTYMDREGYTMAVSPPAFLLAPQSGTALVAHVGTILNSGGAFRGWINYFDDDQF